MIVHVNNNTFYLGHPGWQEHGVISQWMTTVLWYIFMHWAYFCGLNTREGANGVASDNECPNASEEDCCKIFTPTQNLRSFFKNLPGNDRSMFRLSDYYINSFLLIIKLSHGRMKQLQQDDELTCQLAH